MIKLFEKFCSNVEFREEINHFIDGVSDELNLHKIDRREFRMTSPNFSQGFYTKSKSPRSEREIILPKVLNALDSSSYNGALQYIPLLTEKGDIIYVDFLIKRKFYTENKDDIMDSIKEFEDRLQEFLDSQKNCYFISIYNRGSEDVYFQAFSYTIYKLEMKQI